MARFKIVTFGGLTERLLYIKAQVSRTFKRVFCLLCLSMLGLQNENVSEDERGLASVQATRAC